MQRIYLQSKSLLSVNLTLRPNMKLKNLSERLFIIAVFDRYTTANYK